MSKMAPPEAKDGDSSERPSPGLYSMEINLCATVYVKASSEEEAVEKIKKLKYSSPAIPDSGGDVAISGLSYDHPDLPEVSLSPAMTIHDPAQDAVLELVEDYAPEEPGDETDGPRP